MGKFNSFLDKIDVKSLKDFLIHKGEYIQYTKREYFSKAGLPSPYIGYVDKGIFKYVCTDSMKNEHTTGFVFTHEFVADYPVCLYDMISEVSIQAITPCSIYRCEAKALLQYYNQNMEIQRQARINTELLFLFLYSKFLDIYRKTPEEQYKELLRKCPELLQLISLKELASYLRITPTTMSNIRRKITFKE